VKPDSSGAIAARLAQIEHEHFGLQLAQHICHAVALDDVAALDDGYVAAQILGFLQIVRRQYDGGALRVDVAQKFPHGAANLDVDAGGRLIQDQQRGSCMSARAIIRRRFMPPESCAQPNCAGPKVAAA
jgi:hypothetical protein